jgi:hypothetical protein
VPVRIHPEQEDTEVVRWRRERLAQAGFSPRTAWRVAHDWRFDLHGLIELVECGCDPELAIRILAPLDEKEAA